ncbi:MAG: nucleic acid-binding protein, partial [Firmicutes bacterium HGW-Firmicutes-21]
ENKLTDKLENEDNDEFILVENGLFDVSEFVQGSITLELPSRFMCSEDCKGLCPKCGHNLNESLCSCDKREIDPRLAILSEYFGDE